MKKFIILLFCLFAFASINFTSSKPKKSISLVGKVQNDTADIMESKYPVYTSGTGVGIPGGILEEIFLSFHTKEPFNEQQIIRFLVDAAQELVKQVNLHEEFETFLKKTPFTINEVSIALHNMSLRGGNMIDPEITSAGISEGRISYYSVDSEENFKITKRGSRTQEEVLKLLEEYNK